MASRAVPAPGPFSLAILEAVSVWRSGEAGIGGALEAQALGGTLEAQALGIETKTRPRQDKTESRPRPNQHSTNESERFAFAA